MGKGKGVEHRWFGWEAERGKERDEGVLRRASGLEQYLSRGREDGI